MTRFTLIACVLSAALGATAQAQLSTRPGLSDAAQRINDATAARQDAQAAAGSEGAARSALTNLVDKASTELLKVTDPAQAAGEKRIAEALQDLTPEGKALLAQAAASASGAPRAVAAEAGSPGGDGPRPKPLTPESLKAPEPEKPQQKTVITSDDMYFDSAKSIAIFLGNVVVDSPQFHITSDKFEAHMRKQEKDKDGTKPAAGGTAPAGGKPASAKPAPAKPDVTVLAVTAPATLPGGAAAAGAKPPYHDDTIEAAIATGRKVVIIKHNPDGKVQIGQSRYSYYDGDTGDITLKENPQVQDGDNLHTASEPTTVMVMTQSGALHTTGRSTTNLVQAKQETAPAPGTTAPPGTSAPGTVPAPGGAVKTSKGFSIPAPAPGQ